jgi:hypothetical protein
MTISKEVFERFLEVSKAKENYRNSLREMLDFMFNEISDTEEFKSEGFTEFIERYHSVIKDRFHEITTIIKGIYDDYLTEQDLKDMIEFYLTPVGKKYLESSVPMSMEIMKSTSMWAKMVCKEIADDMAADELTESFEDMRGEETWST